MDERAYEQRAAEAFRRVLDLFEDVDPDEVDVEQAGDVLTFLCRGGDRLVLNTQRPARQLWLAGGKRAWHFSFDPEAGEWRDDKRPDDELFATLAALVRDAVGIDLSAG